MIKYHWYQSAAIDALWNYFCTSKGNPVVAMPTGTGKSFVIAGFIHRAICTYPKTRFLVLTHVKELVEQNWKQLCRVWPAAPAGMYCAGLRSKEHYLPVIFGSVGSVAKNVELFGFRDIVVVGECHLLSDNENSLYQQIIAKLKLINPKLKVVGLSATIYRQGLGYITENGIFTDICYDLCNVEMFNRLLNEGFMKPLLARPTETELDVSNVNIRGGEYVENSLAKAVDREEVTRAALTEMCRWGQQRKAWLVFGASIEHAEHINSILQEYGVNSTVVHSKIRDKDRTARIRAYKNGEYKCIVNKNILTTGFDHPPIDLIGMLRPTLSTALNVQMWGRGTRYCQGVPNCIGLDFARNVRQLGPINDPRIPKKKGSGGGDMPLKICESCGGYNHISARFCSACQVEFDIAHKLMEESGTTPFIITGAELPNIQWLNVTRMIPTRHVKEGKPDSLKITYYCGMVAYNEWLHFELTGYPGKHARDWWRKFSGTEPPVTTTEALERISQLNAPQQIQVWIDKQPHPTVEGHRFHA